MKIFGYEITKAEKKGVAYGVMNGIENRRGTSIFGSRISLQGLFDVYIRNSDVHSCVREICQTVGSGGYYFKDKNGRIENDEEMRKVLESQCTFIQTKKRILRDLEVCGNAYIHKVPGITGNKIVGLQVIDPRTIAIIANTYGEPVKYIQRSGGNVVEFEANDIIHIIDESDPFNEVLGFSALEAVIWEAKTDIEAMESNLHFFENDATPSTLYILDEGMSMEKQQIVMDSIKANFGGAKNRNKSGAIPGVKDIKTINVTQKDMEFIEGRRFATEKICAAFGVPKFLLGYTESVNNNNGIELTKNTYASTYKPLEDLLSWSLSRELFIPHYEVEMAFNVLEIDIAGTEKRALEEYKNGVLTLRGYKEKTGQEVTAEDERSELVDEYVFIGNTPTLAKDIGKVQDTNEKNITSQNG